MNDKLKHFLAGATISAVVTAIGIAIYGKYIPDWIVLAAFFLPFVAGVTKEYYDFRCGGTPDVADVTLTWAGGVVVLVWKLIENFI